MNHSDHRLLGWVIVAGAVAAMLHYAAAWLVVAGQEPPDTMRR